MAELTVEKADLTGLSPTQNSASSGGDSFINDGKTFVNIINNSGGSVDVTINVQKTEKVGGVTLTISDPSISIPAGESRVIGPFDKDWFNDSDKLVHIDYSAVTDVLTEVVKV